MYVVAIVTLAPIASRLDDDLLRAALDDVHLLESVRPRRPVVRNEVGEDDTVACRLAADDGSDVDDCAAWHAIGYGALDGECERKPLVDHRDVARGGGFAVGDRRRSHDHLHGRVCRAGVRGCDEQRKEEGSRENVRHARAIMAWPMAHCSCGYGTAGSGDECTGQGRQGRGRAAALW